MSVIDGERLLIGFADILKRSTLWVMAHLAIVNQHGWSLHRTPGGCRLLLLVIALNAHRSLRDICKADRRNSLNHGH